MDLYTAFMKAADHIESHPEDFNFFETQVPGFCGTPACALGWVGFFMGAKPGSSVHDDVIADAENFYRAMHHLVRTDFSDRETRWTRNAKKCAQGMRLYADKFLTKPKLDPVIEKMLGQFDEIFSELA